MKIELTLNAVLKIKEMLEGKKIAYTNFPEKIGLELLRMGILTIVVHGSKKNLCIVNTEEAKKLLSLNVLSGMTIEQWMAIKEQEKVSRAEQVIICGNSKMRPTRTFKGFLIGCYENITCELAHQTFNIETRPGTSLFISDYEHFKIPEDIIIIGIENCENFLHIHQQRYLFEGKKALFVSRYPQSNDLIDWLKNIPNPYLHFGDFDLAGIQIYQTEYYAHLGIRATFFVPEDIEKRLEQGNSTLYDQQLLHYGRMRVMDKRLEPLVKLIHQYRKGYEQEGYIRI